MEDNRYNEQIFAEESSGDFLHIKDITITLLRNLHWFLLCAVIGAFVSWYSVHQKPRIYSSNARISIQSLINDNAIQAPSTQMNTLGSRRIQLNYTAINSEIFALKSKTAMIQVVENLGLNIGYKCCSKVVKRDRDLYGESPVTVDFVDFNGTQYQTVIVTPVSDSLFMVSEGESYNETAAYGDTLATPSTRIIVNKTWFLTDSYYGIPVTVNYRSVNDVADKYRDALQVARNDQMDNVLNLSIRDTSPIKAAAIVNEVIAVYNGNAVNAKKDIIAQTYDYINDRLNSLDSDLSSKEGEIAAFKSANQIVDIKNYGQEFVAGNVEASEEMETLQRQLSLARYVRSAAGSSDGGTLPTGIGLNNSTVDQMIAQYNENAKKLDKYASTGATNNPVVKELLAEQASQKATIENMLDSYIGTMEEKARGVEAYSSQVRSQLRQAPEKQVYIEGVERLQKIKESLYLNLLSKREELLISQPSIEGNARIIDEARVNRNPVAPDEKRQTIVGFLVGLLIPVAIFFLFSIFDTRVRFRDDVERLVSAPFLAEIPSNHLPGDRKNRKKKKKEAAKKKGVHHHTGTEPAQIVVSNKRRDPISEAFRILRSNLEYVKDGDKASNVFLMTSLLESSGKSFITCNLATSLGLVGKKVVVVDCDLRKCTLTKQFSSTKVEGLSEYLSGQISYVGAIVTEGAISECVDAVFTGVMPPNPAELLSDERFGTMMDYLRTNYEYIFLDSIPVGILADAGIIKKYADSTIFVVRSGYVDKRMLPDVEKIYKTGAFPKMNIILNDVEYAKKSRYGHGYGYGYGFGQGYGYGYGHSYGYGSKGYDYGDYDLEHPEEAAEGETRHHSSKSDKLEQ